MEKEFYDVIRNINKRLEGIEELLNKMSIIPSDNELVFYTIEEAARILKVTSKTLKKYRDMGWIEFSTRGRKFLFSKQNLDDFINRSKIESYGK